MQRDFDELIESTLENSKTLNQTGKTIRGWLAKTFEESPLRPVKNFLNGTWLEHPLHPVLTDIPIGAWTAAMAFDAATLFLGTRGLGKATGIAIGIGTLGAVGSIVTGLMDFADTSKREDATVLTHGTLNLTATLLFTTSFFLRKQNGWRTEPSHAALSALGYAAVTAGGFLGGSLVYRHGIMVNRNAHRLEPKQFTDAVALDDLSENKPTRVEVNGEPILFVRRDNYVYAVGAVCSHLGGPLEEGKLEYNSIECPWHYSVFSIKDGSVEQGPTTAPIPLYETRIRDGQVQIRLQTHTT